ncbi:MAG: hypothetical protein A2Y86_01445 [Candidatus Aminicenantes bacterium RBG_13_62_12]|nr:MAG: hypothetical protein A2Y86_01445 [Candidatus Aminicenantes bacterium RBG_13_62_12]
MIAAAGIFLLGSLVVSGVPEARVQETPQVALKPAPENTPGQETPAAPRPPREQMAVYVLLAWVWLSIAVLLGLLRLRVREADRVFRMGLDRAAEKTPRGPGY